MTYTRKWEELTSYHLTCNKERQYCNVCFVHQSKFSVYERAIYAALSGNLSQVTIMFVLVCVRTPYILSACVSLYSNNC